MTMQRIDRDPAGGAVAPLSPEQQARLRMVHSRFATGVTVVAARSGPLLSGMTANAIASISIDPPLLMVSISRKSETHAAIIGSHSFAVSVLAEHQRALAECFAQPTTAAKLRRFCDAPWHEAETGSPILDGAIAFFDCRVVDSHRGGDHTMFIGEIVAAGYEEGAEPLIWYGSRYRRLAAEEPE
ncbi:MAG TPA: flavin reductase family protein [candidate division Zixibacteria bacterium]|nr:flavin reductase family protein [candidate division Zixibacteria bacterium]